MVLCVLGFAGAAMQLAETEVAVGDERAHAVALRERQCIQVVPDTALVVETAGAGFDVAEQMAGVSGETGLALRCLDRALRKAARLVEPAKP